MRPLTSVTTSPPRLAKGASSSTGQQLTVSGSGGMPLAASRELLASEPEQTERRLEASLPEPLSHWLHWRRKIEPGTSSGVDQMQAQIRKAIRREWIEEALKSYRLAELPAPDDVVVKELTSMCATTMPRREDASDAAVYIAAIARRLRAFPGDVVLDVLRSQPDHDKWRPTWQELLLRLEGKTKRRKSTLRLLEEMAA